MSSGCGDVLSLADLQTAKKHQLFEAEVITGKSGGVASGADIDYATNQVTGQTQKTLPAVLRDAGFSPASFTFQTGGTLGTNDADKVVLWPAASGGDGNYYAWKGALPKVIPASSSPNSTGGISSSAWVPITYAGVLDDIMPLLTHLTPTMPEFGAKFDGVTEDADAIIACLSQAKVSGKRVIMPTGYALCSKNIWIGEAIYKSWDFMVNKTATVPPSQYLDPIYYDHAAEVRNRSLKRFTIEFESESYLVANFDSTVVEPFFAYNLENDTGEQVGAVKNANIIHKSVFTGGKYVQPSNPDTYVSPTKSIGLFSGRGATEISKPFTVGFGVGQMYTRSYWVTVSDSVSMFNVRNFIFNEFNSGKAFNLLALRGTYGMEIDGQAGSMDTFSSEQVDKDFTIYSADTFYFGNLYLEDTRTTSTAAMYAIDQRNTTHCTFVVNLTLNQASPKKSRKFTTCLNDTYIGCRDYGNGVDVDSTSSGSLINCDWQSVLSSPLWTSIKPDNSRIPQLITKADFSTYVADGVFGATAKPLIVELRNGNRLLIGYQDGGSNNYVPGIGFDIPGLGKKLGIWPSLDGNKLLLLTGNKALAMQIDAGTMAPGGDNIQDAGSGSLRYKTIYLANPPSVTSDMDKKMYVAPIDGRVLSAWGKVKRHQFKYKERVEEKGVTARTHFGYIAQDIIACFESEGLNAFDYALIRTVETDDGSHYEVVYSECAILESELLRSLIK